MLDNIAAFLYILNTCRVNISTVLALNQNRDLKSQNAFIFVLKLDRTLIGPPKKDGWSGFKFHLFIK